MKSVAVFFGGKSVEKDISIITGVMCCNSLRNKYNVIPIFIDKGGEFFTDESLFVLENYKNLDYKRLKKVCFLPKSNNVFYIKKDKKLIKKESVYCAVNCLHGKGGEDGTLNGLLGFSGIPISSPDILPSALFMDKYATKIFLKGLNVNCLKADILYSVEDVSKIKKSFPLIVKPIDSGSSIGISVARNKAELINGVAYALRYSNRVIVEKYLTDFTEINCAVYKNCEGKIIVSDLEKPSVKKDILTFCEKYENGKREFPVKLEEDLKKQIKDIAQKVYHSVIDKGIIRIDFIVVSNKVYVNEINTVPGSLSYYLFCQTFGQFSDILESEIEYTEKAFNKDNSLIKNYESSVLDVKGSKSIKRL